MFSVRQVQFDGQLQVCPKNETGTKGCPNSTSGMAKSEWHAERLGTMYLSELVDLRTEPWSGKETTIVTVHKLIIAAFIKHHSNEKYM